MSTHRLISYRFFILAFVIATGISTWFAWSLDQFHTVDETNYKGMPSAFVQNVHYLQTNKIGMLRYIMSTPTALYYEDDASVHFIYPHLTVFDKHQHRWNASAAYGHSKKSDNNVILENPVKILESDNHGIKTQLITNAITYDPKRQSMHSSEAGVLIQPNFELHFVGFDANLKTGQLILRSKSKGRYKPHG